MFFKHVVLDVALIFDVADVVCDVGCCVDC
jgi:hypothetical protein